MNRTIRWIPGTRIPSLLASLVLVALAACHTTNVPEAAPIAQPLAAGALRFEPDAPKAGDSIAVAYRPDQRFQDGAALRLRARWRGPDDEAYNRGLGASDVAELVAGDDGIYRARFRLPDGAVFGAFAVENEAADRIDSNDGAFWTLLRHDADGRPAWAALEQWQNDAMGRDAREVLAAARAMAVHFPNDPRAWYLLEFAHGLSPGTADAEAELRQAGERLLALEAEYRAAEAVDPDIAGALYARFRSDPERGPVWLTRLRISAPNHFQVLQQELLYELPDLDAETEAALAELETLWRRGSDGEMAEPIASTGEFAARKAGDAEALLRWTERRLWLAHPAMAESIAIEAASEPALRDRALDWLNVHIEALRAPPADQRALGQSAAEFAEAVERRLASLRAARGAAWLADGRVDEALPELEAAASVGWDPERFALLAEARRQAGQGQRAAEALAAAHADGSASADTALPDWLSGYRPEWSELVARAEADMIERTLADADAAPLPRTRLRARNGDEVTLEALLGEHGAVVVFFSRHCSPSRRTLPKVAEMTAWLAGHGMPLVAVTSDPEADTVAYLEQDGLAIEPYFDIHGEASAALNNWGTPQFFVLDGQGRLRFRLSGLDRIERQVRAIAAH